MTSYYLLLTCLLAIFCLHRGECTKCYTCTSATDSKCADPMLPDEGKGIQCTSNALKEAAEFYNSASKKMQDWGSSLGINLQTKPVDANLQCSKIDISEGDKKVTIRGCTMPPTESFDPCKTLTEKYNSDNTKVSFCGICNTDYCNGASTMKVTAALLLPLFAVFLSNFH